MRPSWDQYFLSIAAVVASRSTCSRKQVGTVITRDHQILSTGYGGSIKGQPHCIDCGCQIDPNTNGCIRTVHAESNAIVQAARNGVSVYGSTVYSTLSPCQNCFKLLANSGIVRIVYDEEYRIPPDHELARACGVEMLHSPTPSSIRLLERDLESELTEIKSKIQRWKEWRLGQLDWNDLSDSEIALIELR